jgi:hypothetical protein
MLALIAAAGVGLASPSRADGGDMREAWFMRDQATGQWCAFTNRASAKTAAGGERFDPEESAWLEYGGDAPVTLVVTLQSDDAYVEDSYSFAPDWSVTKVVRKGHYIDDPTFTATFLPDAAGRLRMTDRSAEAGRNWDHETYFLEWDMHGSFAELPFARLIDTTQGISVSANC